MAVYGRGKLVHILLVEDNEGDVRLTREVLKDAKVRNKLAVCMDGEEALEYLHLRGRHTSASRPDLILLDLNLPLCDGRDVLAQIKADPDLRPIPVVVLTTSAAEQDVLRSYNLHANCYITKPVDLAQFMRVVQTIQDFWLEVVRLPPHTQR
jgi:chemotaxis family two-component system response regulator Rcp1